MSQNPQVVQHRLGIARKALQDIAEHSVNGYGDEWEDLFHIRCLAESALEDMNRETDKSRKRREAEQRVYIERVARKVAKEVDK